MARAPLPFGVQHADGLIIVGELLCVDRHSTECVRLLVRLTPPSIYYDPGVIYVIEIPLNHIKGVPGVISDLERHTDMILGFFVDQVRGEDAVERLVLRHHELGVK